MELSSKFASRLSISAVSVAILRASGLYVVTAVGPHVVAVVGLYVAS